MKQTLIGLTIGLVGLFGTSGAALAQATSASKALEKCQKTAQSETAKYATAVQKRIGDCLQKIAGAVVKGDQASVDVSTATSVCLGKFYDLGRNDGKSLADKLDAKIQGACETVAVADLVGPTSPNVKQPLDTARIDTYCGSFVTGGGAGTLDEWIACLQAASQCQARQQIGVDFPRAPEWLRAMDARFGASTDAKAPRAKDALEAALEAIDADSNDQPDLTCGPLPAAPSGTASQADVLTGKTFSNSSSVGLPGTMPSNGAVTLTPTTSDQAIAAGYHNGSGKCSGDANLLATNIKSGTSIFGVSGSVVAASGNAADGDVLSGKTYSNGSGGSTGTMANNGAVTLTPGATDQTIVAGYHNGSGKCAGDADLISGNIRSGVSLFGVSGNSKVVDTSAATASAGDIASGQTCFANGNLVTGTAFPAAALKTGQTECDQGAGTLGACPGSPAGQDGSSQKGVARSYTVNVNGTITDNKTGLIWEKLDHNNANGIHEYSAYFTWYNAFKKIQVLNGNAAGCIAANNPDACCTGAGAGSCSPFAGYTDWRLPDSFELYSLADLSRYSPAIDPVFDTSCATGCTAATCSCTQWKNYWSATTYQAYPAYAWDVDFTDGYVNGINKTDNYYVRAVRGGS